MSDDRAPDLVGRLVQRARRAAAGGGALTDKARIVLGDALALALESRRTPAGRSAVAYAAAAPDGPSSVVGVDRRVATEAAVLANATLIHALLRDDAHADTMVHPGAVVIPVALAVAEETGAGPADLVAALAAGYEVFAAAAAPAADRTADRGFRNTALYGPLAAAATAGMLHGLDDARLAAAVAIASGSTGGTLQAFRSGSPEWRFQPGLAGQAGLSAARIAAVLDPELVPFPEGALEGAHGLYATVAGIRISVPEAEPAVPALLEVSHKVHETCGANQMPVAALAALVRAGVEPHEIVRVDVFLSQGSFDYPGCEDHGPFVEGATFLSRPFALAATALGGGAPLDAERTRAALADPRLDDLARAVRSHVVAAERLTGAQDAWVEVLLADGSVRRAGADDLDARDLQPDWPTIAGRLEAVPPSGPRLRSALDRLPEGFLDDLTSPLRAAPDRPELP